MTSVPSRLLPLNGNNLVLSIGILLAIYSCGTTKKVTAPPSTTPKTEVEKVRVYDPASGKYVLVPRDAVKVDTVRWTEDKVDPVIDEKVEETSSTTPIKKSRYDVSLLLPLNSMNYSDLESQIDPKLVRFMQYYGGLRIAAKEIERLGLPVTFHSFDTESTITRLNEILKDPAVRSADVIIGPYDKENVESVAAYGLLNDKLVVSPWLPAFSMESNNPNFIQMVPGLSNNAEAIMKYAGDEFRNRKIYLVARNNPTEINRLLMFKKNPAIKTEDLIIDDSSIDLSKTDLSFLLDDPDGTVFIMPYYSRTDEQFVSSFMRKLVADKGTKDVIVFGFPQWTGFNGLNPNYMESLSVHISSPTYLNTKSYEYRTFREDFYTTFYTMPDNQAYQAYDLLMWVARRLVDGGRKGLLHATTSEFGIISGYDLKPVFPLDPKVGMDKKTPLYYENSKLRILKYINQDFELVR